MVSIESKNIEALIEMNQASYAKMLEWLQDLADNPDIDVDKTLNMIIEEVQLNYIGGTTW